MVPKLVKTSKYLILSAVSFNYNYKKWTNLLDIHWTYHNFKTHFSDAYTKHKKITLLNTNKINSDQNMHI